jgi:alkaline phosphatase
MQFFRGITRALATLMACVLFTVSFVFGPIGMQSAFAAGQNDVNVIIMIGDGLGWNMTRSAAAYKTGKLYKSGKGNGLNMQKLKGYTWSTTYGTTIDALDSRGWSISSTGNSALDPTDSFCASATNPGGRNCSVTGGAPVRAGFKFDPRINPGTPVRNLTATASQPCQAGGDPGKGNIVGYEPLKGGPNPWTPISPANIGKYDPEYIKCSYPDSANTASTLYTGVKSYNNAMSVDIYERQTVKTILQDAREMGKSTGLVTSVPITHATPGAATSTVNRRNKYDAAFPALDNILQEAIREDQGFLPTVLLGGGHPLDHINTTATSTVEPTGAGFQFITQATYNELSTKPTSNRYGYTFIERDVNVTKTNDIGSIVDGGQALLNLSKQIDPNAGGRLLGLFGTRGQDGNIPVRGALGNYAQTGLTQFSIFSTAAASTAPAGTPPNNGTQIPRPDLIRPLATAINETDAQFVQKEVKANPTLAEMTQAALNVLGKNPKGFWMMVEGGDIDWAAHDDNMDSLIGNVLAFDDAVGTAIKWINKNGGWKKNVLIVTADHDHYLTLNDDFASKVVANRGAGASDITFNQHTPAAAGHFWGSEPSIKYGWGTHTNRPVPVYYQGPLDLANFIGAPVEFVDAPPNGPKTTYSIPGVPGAVDQAHIYQAMLDALQS